MKKIFLFFVILISLFFISGNSEMESELNNEVYTCDTLNCGYIRMFAVFEKDRYTNKHTSTLIVTDSTTCSIYGAHYELPKDKLTYIYIYNGDRRTARFTWDDAPGVYKIWK